MDMRRTLMSLLETGDVGNELQKLRQDLARLGNDVGDLASALLDAGVETGETAKREARKQTRQQLKRMNKRYRVARRRGDEAVEAVSEKMAERPVAWLSSAFLIGALAVVVLGVVGMRRR